MDVRPAPQQPRRRAAVPAPVRAICRRSRLRRPLKTSRARNAIRTPSGCSPGAGSRQDGRVLVAVGRVPAETPPGTSPPLVDSRVSGLYLLGVTRWGSRGDWPGDCVMYVGLAWWRGSEQVLNIWDEADGELLDELPEASWDGRVADGGRLGFRRAAGAARRRHCHSCRGFLLLPVRSRRRHRPGSAAGPVLP